MAHPLLTRCHAYLYFRLLAVSKDPSDSGHQAVDVGLTHAWVVGQVQHRLIKVTVVAKPFHVVGSGVKTGPTQALDKLGRPVAAHRHRIE